MHRFSDIGFDSITSREREIGNKRRKEERKFVTAIKTFLVNLIFLYLIGRRFAGNNGHCSISRGPLAARIKDLWGGFGIKEFLLLHVCRDGGGARGDAFVARWVGFFAVVPSA